MSLGRCFYNLKKYKQAEGYYKQAIWIKRSQSALLSLGHCYVHQLIWDEGIKVYE
jgi:uncharacterized protein HemY